jgi:hypothetical protein
MGQPGRRSLSLVVVLWAAGCASAPRAANPSPASPVIRDWTPVVEDDSKTLNPGLVWISADELDADFRAGGEPFEAVIERLGNDVLARFRFAKDVLAAAGVRMDAAVTVYVKNARTSSALEAILKCVSEQTPGKPALGYTLGGRNTLLITTLADMYANYTFTRQYPVAEFLVEPDDDERGKLFLKLIRETVDPGSWDANGSKCTMSISKGVLTVTQTHENLRALEQIMEDVNSTYANDVLDRRMNYHGRWVRKH